MNLKVKKLHSTDSTCTDINIAISCAPSRLDTVTNHLPSNGILWRSPKSFKSIDFLAEIDGNLNLPGATHPTTLIAVQVTIQSSKLNEKIHKSVVGIEEHICRGKNVIFVLINPYWTDFDCNYDSAKQATSESGGASRSDSRFHSFWFGHPVSFNEYKTVHESLRLVFGMS